MKTENTGIRQQVIKEITDFCASLKNMKEIFDYLICIWGVNEYE